MLLRFQTKIQRDQMFFIQQNITGVKIKCTVYGLGLGLGLRLGLGLGLWLWVRVSV